ncbi:equilibrative nucleoside transporter 3 isoform X1 [Anoplophora glabripennis]|uniref:equilibrative nucleoside transporter 3 isoform X1 n=1 Tax=Anoplophora glabripennis TaxID=217634 RepID=UPI0008748150|nr:equilibrative nucleoside transporter 3 isoform X1 [Anoplophora glabripennis]
MKKGTGLAIKKVSLCSLDNYGLATIKSKAEKEKDDAPKDRFFYVHILFLIMGLMHMIPYSFFITANAYWMYKFRDVNANLTDASARTLLQTHFSPANSIMHAIVSPATMLMSTFFGFKIKARVRGLMSLSVMSFNFIAATAFVKIDTDSWQVTFFVIIMAFLGMITIANSAISAANLAIISKFPPYYMKVYLFGEGLAGLCSATLQILSLAMGTSTEVSALFYFIAGSSLMVLTLVLFYFSKYNKLFNHYVNSVVEDVNRDVLRLSEIKDLAKQIWAQIVASLLMMLTMSPVTPNITTLVVSENYGSGSEWSDKYFVPVITFLYSDVIGLFGRIASAKYNKIIGGVPFCLFMFVRMVIFVPLIYFCNAQPRNYLPVLFPHDWQYVLILFFYQFTGSFAFNLLFLDVGKVVGPKKAEDAYLVMMSIMSLSTVLLLPVGMFSVDLL